jgi:hypothetical protein
VHIGSWSESIRRGREGRRTHCVCSLGAEIQDGGTKRMRRIGRMLGHLQRPPATTTCNDHRPDALPRRLTIPLTHRLIHLFGVRRVRLDAADLEKAVATVKVVAAFSLRLLLQLLHHPLDPPHSLSPSVLDLGAETANVPTEPRPICRGRLSPPAIVAIKEFARRLVESSAEGCAATAGRRWRAREARRSLSGTGRASRARSAP